MSEAAMQIPLYPSQSQAADPKSDAEPRRLRRKHLIGKLNYLNFTDQTLQAVFLRESYDLEKRYDVVPQPCSGSIMDCLWADDTSAPPSREYRLDRLIFPDKTDTIVIRPVGAVVGERGISVELPKAADLVATELALRYPAEGVEGSLLQNGVRIPVELLNYAGAKFSILLPPGERSSASLIHPDMGLTLILERSGRVIYSAECRLAERADDGERNILVLEAQKGNLPRFPAKEYRSARHIMDLTPRVEFVHPISGVRSSFRVVELSGTGFAVEEARNDYRLIPGLMIQDAAMIFADRKQIRFSLQVIHRTESKDSGYERCGIAILDIEPEDHLAILAVLHQDNHPDSYLNNNLSLDDLWRFFFESGFIYPEKYLHLRGYKERLQTIFAKLYGGRSDIARHFVVQRDNEIHGHLSMVRFYEKTWLIHHHASALSGGSNAGLRVLQQIGCYINESHRFRAMNLDFIMCYFRPENRFPKRIFGGLEPFVGDRQLCSVDSCALFHVSSGADVGEELPAMYRIADMSREDYNILHAFYRRESGGMLLEAMRIAPSGAEESEGESVFESYRSLGIQRSLEVKVLKKDERLIAVYVINRADPGINLSELTNSVMVMIIDSEGVDSAVLQQSTRKIAADYATKSVPVLMYPRESADSLGITADRSYDVWIMRMSITDDYFRHLNSYLRNVDS